MSLSGTVIFGHSTSKRKTRESSTYSSANGDILDEASSALATRRLLVYTLSKVLTERELFPVTCFKNSELRPGKEACGIWSACSWYYAARMVHLNSFLIDLIAQVFKGPQQTSIMEKDVGEHAIKCLKALNCVISRMSQSPNVRLIFVSKIPISVLDKEQSNLIILIILIRITYVLQISDLIIQLFDVKNPQVHSSEGDAAKCGQFT